MWLAIITLAVIAVLTYGFLGAVPRTVRGEGLTRYHLDLFTVAAPQAGIVENVLVKTGARIEKGTPIVKMHGSINSDQQVLTLEEYHDFDIKRHAMRSLILSYLTQYPVLMLGTGLVDPNFQKLHSLVNQSLQGFQHPVYCVHSAVPKFVRDVWAKRNFRFIAVEHKDLTAWLIELSRRVQDRGGEILSHGPREVNVYVKEKAPGWLARDLDGYKRLQDSYTALIHMPDYGWFTGPWEQTLYSPLRRYIRKQIGSRFPGGDDIRFLYCAPGPHAPVLAHESNAALLRNMKQVCMLDIDLEVSHSACKTLEHLGSGDTKLTPAILDFTSGAGQKLCDHLNEIANRLMEGIAPPSSGSAVEEIEAILPLDTLASLGAGQAAQLDGAGDYSVAYSEMVASFTATPVHMAFRTHLFQHIEEIGEPRAHSALEYASELWQYFNQRIFGAHLAFMAATVRPGGLALVAVDTEKTYDDGSNTIFSFPTKEPNERLRETKTPLRRIDTKDFPWRDHAFAFEAKINGMPIDDFKRHSHKVYLYTYERSQ